jgi:hypothetical protein
VVGILVVSAARQGRQQQRGARVVGILVVSAADNNNEGRGWSGSLWSRLLGKDDNDSATAESTCEK